MEHDRTRELHTGRALYSVTPSTPTDAPDAARQVVLCIDACGPMRLQDYFTPDEADQLAVVLRSIAAEARSLASPDAAGGDGESAEKPLS